MKKIAKLLMIGFATLYLMGCSPKEEVIAKVGEKTITLTDLEREITPVKGRLESYYGKDYENNAEALAVLNQQKEAIVEYLVQKETLLQKAKDENIEISEQEIDEEIEATKKQFGSEEAYNEGLQKAGFTNETLREDIKERFTIADMMAVITKDVSVTDEEIKLYYDEHEKEFVTEAGANMYHIVVPTEEEAQKIREEYESGKTFEALAGEYGTDGTKNTGGLLGYVAYNAANYDQDFLKAAALLKEGEVSEPVKTSFGWHLIKVTDINATPSKQTLEQVKEQLIPLVKEEKSFERYNDYIAIAQDDIGVTVYKDRY